MEKEECIISLGLDLSLVCTGMVVLEDGVIESQTTIKSKKDGDSPTSELKRIRSIVSRIEDKVREITPNIIVIENLAFMARNTTALTQLAGLNYFVRALAQDFRIPFVLVAPTSLKKFICGNGAAKKDVMIIETFKRYGVTILDDNLCDAYALAQVGLAIRGKHKKAITKTQQEVLDLLTKQYDN